MTLCQACGGTILSPAISGARRGSCHCNRPNTPEEEMTKSKKRAKAQQQVEQAIENATPVKEVDPLVPLADCPLCGKRAIVALTPEQRLAQPDDTTHVCHPLLGGCNHGFTDERVRSIGATEAPAKVAGPKAPKAPKPISYEPQGEVKATKAGSKLSVLIDRLGQEGGTTFAELTEALSASGSKVDVAGVRSWISYDLRRVGLGCHQVEDRLFLVGTPLPHRDATPKKAQETKLEVVKKAAGSSKPKSKKAAKS